MLQLRGKNHDNTDGDNSKIQVLIKEQTQFYNVKTCYWNVILEL